MARHLFVSGTARGGTNLAIMMASVLPEVALVQDPYLAFLKAFRNTLMAREPVDGFDLHSPLDEYYYEDRKLDVMRRIQDATLDVPFDERSLAELRDVLANRMRLSAPLMLPFLNELRGTTYREVMQHGLEIIGKAWKKPDAAWLGFNDNWAIEFFGPLARTFPDAKFLSIVRDGRSAVASHVRILEAQHTNPLYQYEKQPNMVALTLSFVRCWRKQVAFTRHYQHMLGDRLHVLSYEHLVTDPEGEARKLAAFLDLEYRPEMIDASRFIAGDGNVWLPNSNHENAPQGRIYADTIGKWKATLTPDMVDLIEFVAGPDLALAGYETTREFGGRLPWGALATHRAEHEGWIGGGFGWRTDHRDPERDFGYELVRRAALADRVDDPDVIARLFLFPEVYESLLAGGRLLD